MEEENKKMYLKCKYRVKKWESEFKQVNGTNPSKTDIRNAPSHIREAYKTYWKLKTHSLETSLVDVTFQDEDTVDGFSFSVGDNTDNSLSFIDNSLSMIENSSTFVPEVISDATLNKNENEKSQQSLILPDEIKEYNSKSSLIVADNKNEDKKDTTELKDTKTETNAPRVWGSHLSNIKTVEKPKPEKSSVLSRFTSKLFAGATFKKRNPRKAFIRREKSANDTLSQLDDSQSSISEFGRSFSQPEMSSTILENISCVENEKHNTFLDSLDLNTTKFKVVNTSQTHKDSQPVSLLQQSLQDNTTTKTLGHRTVNKGWLDRIEKVTNTEIGKTVNSSDSGIELTDSSVVSVESKSSPPCPVSEQKTTSDDEDFVCDSDCESENTSSFSITSKQRSFTSLSGLSNCGFKRTYSSLSRLNESKTERQIVKPEKRLIEQVESATTVSDSKRHKPDESVVSDHMDLRLTGYSLPQVRVPVEPQVKYSAIQQRKLVEIQNKHSKETRQKEILEKKLSSGKVNENFVKINIKKKTYVRGKKTMTFQKYKKQKWKEMKKSQSYSEGGVYKCFKCGDIGHYAKNCLKACDTLLPQDEVEGEDDSPFPSLEEAEAMARETAHNLCVRRNINDLPVHVVNDGKGESVPPPLFTDDDLSRLIPQEPLFKLNDDGSLIDTPLVVVEALVRFGHEGWRAGQEQAVMRVLSGLSTLVTLSTGSGKSLCYQLPAYLYHTLQQRITLIVSPLVSLMEDQVFGVPSCLKLACLHANMPPAARQAVFDQMRANSLHALLVSPETLAAGDRLTELLRNLPPVAFACIDEAHCISQWSHNFRPSYLMVCQILREKFGVKTILGLTATATVATIASVSSTLGLPDGVAGVISDTPLPDNLRLSVSRDRRKDEALIQLLQGRRFSQCQSIIIYCTRRDQCQRLAAYIRTCLQDVSKEDGTVKRGKLSWNAEAYHAGLTPARRRAVQKAFMSGKTRIVVATVAFGMGINKQDIQGIIHYNMPSAFERYVQEVGRAGRDGRPAHCHLFLNTEGEDLNELRRHVYADSVERHTIRRLLQRVFQPCSCGVACGSHEVAFSVADAVATLDLPEENIATLLCYLELHARQWAHVCSPAYTHCRLLSYKGPKLIKQAAKECPPLAVAIAMEVEKGIQVGRTSKLEFPIFPVVSAIKWDSGIIKRQLKQLEWTKVNDQPRRSGLTVEFYDLGFRVQAPGNLSAEELDSALDSLTERVEAQEHTALRQLQAIFNTLIRVSHKTVEECLDEADEERCDQLKANVRQYFTQENYLDSHDLPHVELNNEEQVVNDIRNLVNSYRDVTFSGRAVARIFHGIASPNYEPRQWGRCRFWRAHLHEDFKLLCKLATRELIKMR